MRRFTKLGLIAGLCGFAAGCAYTPDAEVTYYLPKSSGSLLVTRALSCDVDDTLNVVSQAVVRTSFSADTKSPHTIKLRDLDGAFANTGTSIKLYSDGRLKGVNSSSTGRGGHIVEAALGVAGSALSFRAFGATTNRDKPSFMDLCNYINKKRKHDDGSPVRNEVLVLEFTGSIKTYEPESDDSGSGKEKQNPPTVTLKPTPRTDFLLGKLDGYLSRLNPSIKPNPFKLNKATVSLGEIPKSPVADRRVQPTDVMLKMVTPRLATVTVEMGNKSAGDLGFYEKAGASAVLTQYGTEYVVPIPKAAVFGSHTFTLAVDEAGAITELGYGKDTGVGDALGAAQSAFDQIKPSTAAEKAAAAKAEADLIMQRRRLARCQADPATCQ